MKTSGHGYGARVEVYSGSTVETKAGSPVGI
jgi:hypothetical protein